MVVQIVSYLKLYFKILQINYYSLQNIYCICVYNQLNLGTFDKVVY